MRKTGLYLSLIFVLFLQTALAVSPGKLFVGVVCDKPVYRSNETIAIALTVLNQNASSYKATFTSGKKYDFYLYNQERLVWKWSDDKMFPMVFSNLNLEPRKPITYVAVLSLKSPSGQPIEPGRYKITGAFCTKDKEYLSEPVAIEVRN